jgi:hypothetical protein
VAAADDVAAHALEVGAAVCVGQKVGLGATGPQRHYAAANRLLARPGEGQSSRQAHPICWA